MKEDTAQVEKLLDVLESVKDPKSHHGKEGGKRHHKRKQGHREGSNLFDFVLTKDHCLQDKNFKLTCRCLDIFLQGREQKDILFIANEPKDLCLVHDNGIVVRSYFGNKLENTLAKLKLYLLKHVQEAEDVR